MKPYLDPASCPAARPPVGDMGPATRELHAALDANAPWLHPRERTIQRDLYGSPNVVSWQEAKAAFLIAGDGAWSELPHLYARYGTPGTSALIHALRGLEQAQVGLVTDSGMQAIALVADALLIPGGHAVILRQIYNKAKTYFEWLAKRVGATLTFVDDGDPEAVAVAVRPNTRFVFAETFTNPLMRAQDLPRLLEACGRAHLVIDTTIATPWAFETPALKLGATVVVGSLTKALGGQDTALGGYICTDDTELGNQLMDLLAMRGGILDDARALAVANHLPAAAEMFTRRCATASKVAAFLAAHPKIEAVYHPSLPDHPDARVIAAHYAKAGSIVSFRAAGTDELGHRHLADVLVSTIIPRYALSFDGLATKVNHHKTVSEYFTPPDQIARQGIDRLIRLGIGLEDADDLIACLNWSLHHAASITTEQLDAWRAERARSLGL